MPGGPKPKRKPAPKRASGRPSPVDGWGCPGHLTGDARVAWGHLVGLLHDAGNLNRTDPTIVLAYAINYDLLRQAQKAIKAKGAIIADRFGVPREHPAVRVVNAATIRLKGIAYDLGLVPATSKYSADPPISAARAQDDDWSDFGIVG